MSEVRGGAYVSADRETTPIQRSNLPVDTTESRRVGTRLILAELDGLVDRTLLTREALERAIEELVTATEPQFIVWDSIAPIGGP